jgi:hypothetical protein
MGRASSREVAIVIRQAGERRSPIIIAFPGGSFPDGGFRVPGPKPAVFNQTGD